MKALKSKLKGRAPIVELHLMKSAEMKRLNLQFRKKNKPTDVLSFLSSSSDRLGTVLIDLQTAQKQADFYKHSLKQEIEELFIHGLLHLLGFDHEKANDARIMARYEIQFGQTGPSKAKAKVKKSERQTRSPA